MQNITRSLLLACAAALVPVFASAADVKENWVKHCQKCHAADGSGSTPVGKKLKVLNYTLPEVQAAMTDEEIVRITRDGAKDEAGKTTMPAYADKLTEEEIQAMIGLIRSFQKG
jgi:mono/diheme cytochrome c family protein